MQKAVSPAPFDKLRAGTQKVCSEKHPKLSNIIGVIRAAAQRSHRTKTQAVVITSIMLNSRTATPTQGKKNFPFNPFRAVLFARLLPRTPQKETARSVRPKAARSCPLKKPHAHGQGVFHPFNPGSFMDGKEPRKNPPHSQSSYPSLKVEPPVNEKQNDQATAKPSKEVGAPIRVRCSLEIAGKKKGKTGILTACKVGCRKLTYHERERGLEKVPGSFLRVVGKEEGEAKNRVSYFTGGMIMPGLNYQGSTGYRYGYQGSEKDDEIAGVSNGHFTTYFREGDTRILRWWSVDPKARQQPWQSSYSYMDGNPVLNNDQLGDCVICPDKLLNRAKSYVANKAKQAVAGLAVATARYVNKKVTDIKSTMKVEVAGEVHVSAGAQYGGKVDKAYGTVRNYGSVDLFGAKLGFEVSAEDGFEPIWDPYVIGKGGDVRIRMSHSNNAAIVVPGGEIGAGGDTELTTTYNYRKGELSQPDVSHSRGASVDFINASGTVTFEGESGDITGSVGVGIGGEAAFGIGIRGNAGANVSGTLVEGEDK